MKRTTPFVLLLAALSALSGYLLSKASFVGRAGISLFYKEYRFLKTGWQGALVVFTVLLLLFILQGIAQRKLSKRNGTVLHLLLLALVLTGWFLTYHDFQNSLSHRLLGMRFHTGAYLFWVEWLLICLYYLTQKKKQPENLEKERGYIAVSKD